MCRPPGTAALEPTPARGPGAVTWCTKGHRGVGLGACCPPLAAQRGCGDPKSALQVDGVLLNPPAGVFFFASAVLCTSSQFSLPWGILQGEQAGRGLAHISPVATFKPAHRSPLLVFHGSPQPGRVMPTWILQRDVLLGCPDLPPLSSSSCPLHLQGQDAFFPFGVAAQGCFGTAARN